jgi:uncharacterized protein YjbI with pentapeptide repeats
MKPKLTTKILKYLLIASVAIAVAYALIWTVLQGYSAPWTGFGDYTKPSSDFVRGKTLWDWIQLFIIPLVGSIGIFLLNRSEREGERRRAEERATLERQRGEERAKLEREMSADRQREEALQSYLERMANLLLEKNLLKSEIEEVKNVARIWTLTVLRGLDETRKGIVLRFVCEAGLIYKDNIIVNLNGAYLRDAILSNASLRNTYLGIVDLRYANLLNASLKNADLSEANMQGANMQGAYLRGADLRVANMRGTNMQGACLSGAILINSDLQDSDLTGTDLTGADLTGADLKFTNLQDADLTSADLTGAKVTNEQLATVKSIKGAIMPDGTIHD